MMEEVNWTKHEGGRHDRGDLIAWIILHAITKAGVALELSRDPTFDLSKLRIDFRVNGAEIPFVETMRDIELQLDRMIQEKVQETISDKFVDVYEKIGYLHEVVGDAEQKIKEKFGINYDYDDDK